MTITNGPIDMNRREMIKTAAGATAMTVLGIPLAGKNAEKAVKGKKKILVIGAHPDDPETCIISRL